MLTAIVLFVGTMLLSLWASARVKSVYRKYSQEPAVGGITGAEAARRILEDAGVDGVEIEAHPGELTDHYDPMHRRLVLSEGNYYGNSVAALAVSAHEAGHAIQHARAYLPLHLRMAAVGATQFASQIVMWLPILGMVTGFLSTYTGLLIMAVGWGIIMLFNLITLPVEFDASNRAKAALMHSGILSTITETSGVNKVLNAAAWTYVAAFITSLAYFLWHLLPLLMGRREE
ncbi:MAG: zinc metallopeptidase [Terrimicrobiaceae bacterium]|nr:zinc metallopeptidase [Terrimicrobiaceae bacterium]